PALPAGPNKPLARRSFLTDRSFGQCSARDGHTPREPQFRSRAPPQPAFPPTADDLDKHGIGPSIENAHHRIAEPHREKKASGKQADADQSIRPGIERPLMTPPPGPFITE